MSNEQERLYSGESSTVQHDQTFQDERYTRYRDTNSEFDDTLDSVVHGRLMTNPSHWPQNNEASAPPDDTILSMPDLIPFPNYPQIHLELTYNNQLHSEVSSRPPWLRRLIRRLLRPLRRLRERLHPSPTQLH